MKENKNTVSTFSVIMAGLMYKTVLYSVFMSWIPFRFPAAIILLEPISAKLKYSETWKWLISQNSPADAAGLSSPVVHI